jgi:hypothetical protein
MLCRRRGKRGEGGEAMEEDDDGEEEEEEEEEDDEGSGEEGGEMRRKLPRSARVALESKCRRVLLSTSSPPLLARASW